MPQERNATDGEIDQSTLRTPLLVRATLILFALNLVIAAWFFISPNTTYYPEEVKAATQSQHLAENKISPFEPAQVEKVRRGPRLPVKIEPVIAQVIPEETIPPVGRLN